MSDDCFPDPTQSLHDPKQTPRLNPEAYPHIIDQILEYCETPEHFALRATSRELKHRVDTKLYRHIVLSCPCEKPSPVWVPLKCHVGSFDYLVWSHPQLELPGRHDAQFRGALRSTTRVLSVNGPVMAYHPDFINNLKRLHTLRLICWCCKNHTCPPFAVDNVVVITKLAHQIKGNCRRVSRAEVPSVPEGVKSLVVTVRYHVSTYNRQGGFLDSLPFPSSLTRAVVIFKPEIEAGLCVKPRGAWFPHFRAPSRFAVDILDSVLVDVARTLYQVRYTLVAPPLPPRRGSDEGDVWSDVDSDEECEEGEIRERPVRKTAAYYQSIQDKLVVLVLQHSELSLGSAEDVVRDRVEVISMETYRARVGGEQFALETEA